MSSDPRPPGGPARSSRGSEIANAAQGTVEKLLRQQAALADFGSFAFGEADLQKILAKAVVVCAAGLETNFAKICRFRESEDDLLVVAGCGWAQNVVGYVVSPANESSTQGRAFVTGEPVILEDLAKNNSYVLPAFYGAHGIVATVDVLIKSRVGSWAVLEVDSEVVRKFDHHDIVFLTGFANVLAEGVAAAERQKALREAAELADVLLAEQKRLTTDRDEADRRLHEMQAELLRVSRLNAMGQMTAAIAHELNQPLAAMANYIAAVKRTLQTSAPDASVILSPMIDKAADQTRRAGDIIKNLRRFVERREGTRTAEDIGDVIQRSLALANFTAPGDAIAVTVRIDETLAPVNIDAVQIQQVLVNLIRNSVDALRGRAARELLIVVEQGDAGFARVTLRDSGPGLPASVREKLFQPFVNSSETGMGLDLTICDVLVQANGGNLALVPGLDGGAGFSFSLPSVPAA